MGSRNIITFPWRNKITCLLVWGSAIVSSVLYKIKDYERYYAFVGYKVLETLMGNRFLQDT